LRPNATTAEASERSLPAESAAPSGSRGWELLVLLVVILAPLAFFSDKAFSVDDPLFVWLGRHIRENPLDFFGFDVNWSWRLQPMYDVTRNPPLAGHYIAVSSWMLGWSERALHLAFLLPASAVVVFTWLLARRLCVRPLAAALLGLFTPVFLVSGSSVMCDMLMLACWCGALYCWVRGIDGDGAAWLLAGALLTGFAALAKYFGVALLPLMAAYGLARRRRVDAWLLPLLVPCAMLVGYELWTRALYGVGLLVEAGRFAASDVGLQFGFGDRVAIGLVFAGGCLPPALLLAPFLWGRRALLLGLAAACLLALHIDWNGRLYDIGFLIFSKETPTLIVFQFLCMLLGGASVVGLGVAELRKRDPDAWLIGLWILGTVVFATFLNWTNNGRSNLPLAPVVGIAIVRRLDRSTLRDPRALVSGAGAAAALGFVLAGAAALGDVRWANETREAARKITRRYATPGRAEDTWVLGHWGLQYYMEEGGARSVDYRRDEILRGDIIVEPVFNYGTWELDRGKLVLLEELVQERAGLVHTMDPSVGAGFYASNIGPMPFALGGTSSDAYRVWRAKDDFHVQRARPPRRAR